MVRPGYPSQYPVLYYPDTYPGTRPSLAGSVLCDVVARGHYVEPSSVICPPEAYPLVAASSIATTNTTKHCTNTRHHTALH